MLIQYQIKNFGPYDVDPAPYPPSITASSITVSGGTTEVSKSITIPINLEFYPIDYTDGIQNIVKNEIKKNTNPIIDGETIKYWYQDINNTSVNNGQGLYLQFRFWNTTSNTYTLSYEAANITTDDIVKLKNGFKKSFFRLYFYDSNTGDTSNLIFTEDLNVYDTTVPNLQFNRLYWLRNDNFFVKNNINRTIYMNASFFNAKTGKIHRFINIPTALFPSNSTTVVPLTIEQYSDPSKRDWRTSAITVINPKLNNGEYNFTPVPGWGSNTPSTITLSEFIIK